jgi:hypothetical protein
MHINGIGKANWATAAYQKAASVAQAIGTSSLKQQRFEQTSIAVPGSYLIEEAPHDPY